MLLYSYSNYNVTVANETLLQGTSGPKEAPGEQGLKGMKFCIVKNILHISFKLHIFREIAAYQSKASKYICIIITILNHVAYSQIIAM